MGIDAARDSGIPLDVLGPKLVFISVPHVGGSVQIGGESGSGSSGGNVLIDQGALRGSFILHEMGHSHGLNHTLYMDGAHYGSPYCLMSAEEYGTGDPRYANTDPRYADVEFGPNGPQLCSAYAYKAGWLPHLNVVRVPTNGESPDTTEIILNTFKYASTTRPQAALVEFTVPQKSTYFIEYRRAEDWDLGLDHDAVVIHQMRSDGSAYYAGAIPSSVGFRNGLTLLPGDRYIDRSFDLMVELVSVLDGDAIELQVASRLPRWAPQQVGIGGGSSAGPSLAVFRDRLFAAWKGADSDQRMFWSSFDGTTWAPQQVGIGGGSSAGPSLAVFLFQDRLFAAWKGADSDQRMFWSSFGT